MQLYTESNVVDSAGMQKTTGFQIAATAHAFRMLSSGLYSDKIGAVLREIGCNAADAHIAAGKPDLPFEVHLPNRLTSKFYIRDFGPGMPHNDVLNLYTTYFASSKQQSNDFTGAFGLGSKSPFSYTDTFTIVSVHNGTKTTYSAYVGTTGAPQISVVDSSPADQDWPSGMMISLPVQPSDYIEFQTKAQRIFRWFRVPPKMVNSPPIQPRQFTVETEDYLSPADRDYVGVSVLMGNVWYPVPSSEYSQIHAWAHHVNPILKLPIGAVDVAASRENLEFTPRTRAAIGAAIARVQSHIGKELAAKANTFDLTNLKGMYAANDWLVPLASQWGGKILSDFLRAGGVDQVRLDQLDHLMTRHATIATPQSFAGQFVAFHTNQRMHLKQDLISHVPGMIYRPIPGNIQQKRAILQLGKTKYLKDRLRNNFREGNYDYLFVVSEDDAEAERIAKEWYDFPIVKAEDLALPIDWVRPSLRRKGPRVRKADIATGRMAIIDATAGEFNIDEEFVLADADADQKFFVTPTVAWGRWKWNFHHGAHYDYSTPLQSLAMLAKYVPEVPRGIALLKKGEITRCKLVEKRGWQDLSALADVIQSPAIRDKVNNIVTEGPQRVDKNGYCYAYESPLQFFASHAKANNAFWKHLIQLCPNSLILAEAQKVAAGNYGLSPTQPIPCELYNDVVRALGLSNTMKIYPQKAKTNTSAELYPLFSGMLGYTFPNNVMVKNQELTAEIVAKLLEADEQKISSPIQLVA